MTLSRSLLVLICCSGLLAPYGGAANLNGRIVITRRITKKRITLPAYQLRGVSSLPPESAGPLIEYRNIVVFLEDNLADSGNEEPIRAELVQRNRRFEPQIVVIPVGSTVSFPNEDPIFHNVFSLSSVKQLDLGYYPAGRTRVTKFDQPGVVQVYCHLHPNMYAAVVVVPNRWHTLPADDGTFSLKDVPTGKHRLVAWHMSAGFFRKAVHVLPGGGGDIVISMPVHDAEFIR